MKYAVKMIETSTRTVVVDTDNYMKAEEKVTDAYDNGSLWLDADNASVELCLENDTENYIEIFGEEGFIELENTI